MSPEGILTRFSSVIVRALLGHRFYLSVLLIFETICRLTLLILLL